MKPVQLIAILGGLLIVGVVAWYLYMESNPPYATSPVRGLDLPAAKRDAPKSATPKSATSAATPKSAATATPKSAATAAPASTAP